MKHITRVIEAQHSATGLVTIAAVKVTDDGVERQEWVGTWEEVQYSADLMPSLLDGLLPPSSLTASHFKMNSLLGEYTD